MCLSAGSRRSPICRFVHSFVTSISSLLMPGFNSLVTSTRYGGAYTSRADLPFTFTSAMSRTLPRSIQTCWRGLNHDAEACTVLL
jgi:hypothetical protein